MKTPLGIEEAVRLALTDLRDAPASVIAAHVERTYGVRIDPRFLPVYRASILGRERREQFRPTARAVDARPASDSPPGA